MIFKWTLAASACFPQEERLVTRGKMGKQWKWPTPPQTTASFVRRQVDLGRNYQKGYNVALNARRAAKVRKPPNLLLSNDLW
jgi:hypothetical protein